MLSVIDFPELSAIGCDAQNDWRGLLDLCIMCTFTNAY